MITFYSTANLLRHGDATILLETDLQKSDLALLFQPFWLVTLSDEAMFTGDPSPQAGFIFELYVVKPKSDFFFPSQIVIFEYL